jgi:thiol-disulfide isomerase/thioredoxin
MPEFIAGTWLQGSPQRLAALRGRVVLIDFWTFGWGACTATVPWLKSVEERFGPAGLAMVGVHTPEFFYERSSRAVEAECRKLGVDYPQLVDREGAYWEAAGNRAWPAVYLVGKDGRILARYTGTVRQGEHNAVAIEREIADALAR